MDRLKLYSLLFEKTLYENTTKEEPNMNVVVIGDGESIVSFIDVALQSGQLPEKVLNLYVFSSSCSEDNYMSTRPHLNEFVNVSNSLKDYDAESYGNIYFNEYNSSTDSLDYVFFHNDEKTNYIFINFLDQNETIKVAKQILDGVSTFELKSTIVYSIDDELYANSSNKFEKLNLTCTESILEKIAYNVHISWADYINGDYESSYKSYIEPYNHESSLAFASSIKYKLQVFGINVDNLFEAAITYDSNVNKNDEKFYTLVYLEHRRWVLSQLINGWGPIDNNGKSKYKYALKFGDHKNKELKQHPCIVRSSKEHPLKRPTFNWEMSTLNELDDLDKFSVEYHNYLSSVASNLKNSMYLDDKNKPLEKIRNIIEKSSNKDLAESFKRYDFVVRNVLEGISGYCVQFSKYTQEFLDDINKYDNADIEVLNRLVSELRLALYPCINAIKKTDFKAFDERLIRKIPFILTYNARSILAQGFEVSDSYNSNNSILFKNVATAIVIKPKELVYFIDANYDIKPQKLIKNVKACVRLLKAYCKCKVSVVMTCHKDSALINMFNDLVKDGIISKFDYYYVLSGGQCIESFVDYYQNNKIDYFDGVTEIFKSPKTNADFIYKIDQIGKYFEFDYLTHKFKVLEKTIELSFIEDNSFIKIENMFNLMGCDYRNYNLPNCSKIYNTLFGIYTGKISLQQNNHSQTVKNVGMAISDWNFMCDVFSEYFQTNPGNTFKFNNLLNTSIAKRNDLNKKPNNPMHSSNRLKKMIMLLMQYNFINVSQTYSEKELCYSIPDKNVLKIISKAGEILEIHTYYSCCKLGLFDDIVTGYEFGYKNTNVKNEADIILTKGFKSIIVECKGTKKLDQAYYHKLNSLADTFGINSINVIVATAHTNHSSDIIDNNMQIERGKVMDIVTISEFDDIENIGQVLYNMIK